LAARGGRKGTALALHQSQNTGKENAMIRRLMQFFVLATMAAACPAQPQSVASTPAGWRTYHSADYGFTIAFPAEMTFYSGHPVPPPHRAMIPVCDDLMVACFEYNGQAFDRSPVQSLGVSIDIRRDLTTEAQCEQIGERQAKTVVIHGARYHSAEVGSAATGNFGSGRIYRSFHQHVCFEIALNEAGVSVSPAQFGEYRVHAVDQRAYRAIQDEMHRMLETFTFVGPVHLGANWRVYPDSESTCDGQFEVPIDTAVEEVNPASPDGVYSSGVTCAVTFTERGRLYLIAENVDLGDSHRIDDWLGTSAFPSLAGARRLPNGTLEYKTANLAYFVIRHELIVFAVSNPANGSRPQHDRIFDHLVSSFRMP
jgi:hypothetical protein